MKHIQILTTRIALLILILTTFAIHAEDAKPKNAILFIGDGMGLAQVTAARIYQGGARDGKLTLDTLPHTALVRTWCANNTVTDSAAAGTSLAAGEKANTAAIGITPDKREVETILDLAKKQGKAVGIITTTTITHATPACFYAHVPFRADEKAIAVQLAEYGTIDVIMGGGREYFLPKEITDGENGEPGTRTDGRNLIEEMKANGYRYAEKKEEFDALAEEVNGSADAGKVLCLFSPGTLSYELERAGDKWGEPSLAEMTALAIKILRRNPNGYFLMVEGGKIDHAAHNNEAHKMVTDLIAFDQAIKTATEVEGAAQDTLIVITADHETGGVAINGYPPIGSGGPAMFEKAMGMGSSDTITFASGPGADRSKMEGVERTDPGYKQPSLFPASSALHTGIDVIAWGWGPGSGVIRGTLDNTDIAKQIMYALGLRENPDKPTQKLFF